MRLNADKRAHGFGIRFPAKREIKANRSPSIRSVRTPIAKKVLPPNTGQKVVSLEGLTVCVGYSDYLDLTLPWNIKHFDRFVVVTHPDDINTQEVVKKHGGLLVLCPECKGNIGGFNKGKALNAGIGKLKYDDWVLFTDADVMLPSNFRSSLKSIELDQESLYYAARWYSPETDIVQWVENYKKDETITSKLANPFADAGSIIRDVAPWGYFQLVNARSQVLKRLGKSPCSTLFNSAGGVDKQFHEMWPASRKFFSGYNVVHLFHGDFASNWRGRTTPPLPGKAEEVKVVKIEKEIPIAWLDSNGYQFVTSPPSGGYLKLIRMDTLDYVVVSNLHFPQGLFMGASGGFSYGAYHAGFISKNYKYKPHVNFKGKVIVARDVKNNIDYSGWGIGHVMLEDNRQAWVWDSKEISPANFEIYWKQNLSEEDTRHLIRI